jgi:hypothetical protein
MFLVDINTGTWTSKLGEFRIWGNKIWFWVPRNSGPRITAPVRASNNCKRQIRPPGREGATYQQTHYCLTIIKNWSWAPDGCLTPRKTDRLTVGRNITMTLISFVEEEAPFRNIYMFRRVYKSWSLTSRRLKTGMTVLAKASNNLTDRLTT